MIRSVRRWVLAPLVGEDYVLDVAAAPEALASRLRSAISTRPKRALGVLKVSAEWVGIVAGNEFVVWEKQQHATRAIGKIHGRRGGSRVEVRIEVTRRTWILITVFFGLFMFASAGLLTREEGLGVGPAGLTVAALGAFVTLSLFWSASLRQRAALRAFLSAVLGDREAPSDPRGQ